MRIVASELHRDYYDWVAGKYGGGDPRVVYLRRLVNPDEHADSCITLPVKFFRNGRNVGNSEWVWSRQIKTPFYVWETQDIVVCGRRFLAVRQSRKTLNTGPDRVVRHFDVEVVNDWRVIQDRDHPYLKLIYPNSWDRGSVDRWLNPPEEPDLIVAARIIQAPVFRIVAESTVSNKPPQLGSLGFAAHFTAEQMYQQIAYFVGNLLYESPDLSPPTQMSDREKILAHGFDLKRSFRH